RDAWRRDVLRRDGAALRRAADGERLRRGRHGGPGDLRFGSPPAGGRAPASREVSQAVLSPAAAQQRHVDLTALQGLRSGGAEADRGEVPAPPGGARRDVDQGRIDRKSTRLNSSHSQISYAVFCL